MLHTLIIIAIVVIDQISKGLVRVGMTEGQQIALAGDLVHLTYVHNTGAAFGILPGQTIFLIVVTLGAIAFMFWYRQRLAAQEKAARTGLSLIIGGAFGNLIDRLISGQVVDFIDIDIPDISIGPLSFFGYKWSIYCERWPAFNVADSAISIGLLFLIWYLWHSEDTETAPLTPGLTTTEIDVSVSESAPSEEQ